MSKQIDKDSTELFSKEEMLLKEIQEHCANEAYELVNLICNRTKRAINSWGAYIFLNGDDYPMKFTNYDILACEHQTKFWEEINPFLENAVRKTLKNEYEDLPSKDKFFIEYSECYCKTDILNSEEIDKIIFDRFIELLNDHWANSKKIQEFEEKRAW